MARISAIFISEVAEPELLPSLAHSRLVVGRRTHGGWEPLAAPFGPALQLPRAGRVDQHAIPESGAELRDVPVFHRRARIDRRAEDPWEDHDAVLPRVDPMREGPVDLLVGGGIDVLLDDGDVLVPVLRRARAPERRGDLLGLALIRLLDLDDDIHAIGDRRHEDVAYAGNSRRRQDVPRDRRALHARHHAVLAVRARQGALEAAAEDRIAAVRDARHVHCGAWRRHVRDVTRELAKGSLCLIGRRVVADEALDDDLGAGRHLQVDRLAADELGRLAAICTHHVPLADAGRDRRARQERHDRIPADHAGHRHRLSARRVFQEVLAPVLAALDEQERRGVLLADHAAIDADVHRARLRIARDDPRERVDVASALKVVPLRDRKLRLVDVVAANDHFLDGPGRDDPRWDRLSIELHDVLDQVPVGHVLGIAERKREATDAPETADEELRAASGLVALDTLEEQRGALLLEHAARDRAELPIPVHLGLDPPQLPFRVEPRDPLAHVDEAHGPDLPFLGYPAPLTRRAPAPPRRGSA